MRKVFLLILVLLCISTQICANDQCKIYLSTDESDTSEILLHIENAENTLGGSVVIEYDSNVLGVKECNIIDDLGGAMAFVNPNYADNKIKLTWASAEVITYTSPLLSVSFDVIVEEGEAPSSTKVKITNAQLYNIESEKIQCEASDIDLTIPGGNIVTPPDDTDSSDDASSKDSEDDSDEVLPEDEEDSGEIIIEESEEPTTDNTTGGNTPSSSGVGTHKEKNEAETTVPVVKEDEPTIKWQNPFNDVSENDWFYGDVEYAVKNKLLNGTAEDTFSPDKILTRAMLVTAIYRMDNNNVDVEKNADTEPLFFDDVPHDSYYADAVLWARQEGIVNGVSETHFAPDNNITREQIAAIMYRYAKYRGYDVSIGENTNILSYDDFDNISEYAIESMQYAAGMGFMKGKTQSTLNPEDNATRAEIAAVLHRFIEGNN